MQSKTKSAGLHSDFDVETIQKVCQETPGFIFSKKRIIEKFTEFTTLFPGALVHYAMKANSEPDVLKTLDQAGCGFEVASGYELAMLKELGVSPEKINYGTSVKPFSHIQDAFDYGVRVFAADSIPELDKIAAAAPGSSVYVRVAVNDSGSVFKFSEKFGTDIENVEPFLLHARDIGLKPYGMSFHVGSQASNPDAWSNALKILKKPMESLALKGVRIDMINIGGGYPCAYQSAARDIDVKEISKKFYAAYEELPYKTQLMLEPGRGIIATAGVLIAQIIGRVERRGNTWLFLDTGVYDSLFEAMAYQGSTQYKVTSMRQAKASHDAVFALAGPTGDSPDIITRHVTLPRDSAVGDKLIIHDVGAYSLVVSSRFNGFPKPKVYYI